MTETDVNDAKVPAERTLEEKKADLLRQVAEARLTSVQTRVAWLLNHVPECRNSDITLQLNFWERFCPDIYRGGPIDPRDLYRLPRLTTLSRARAAIQNVLGLFLADPDVRRVRGTLVEDTQREQRAVRGTIPSFSVFIDESGKTGDHLIVGSCWLLNGIESLAIARSIDEWAQRVKFHSELHFSDIGRGNIERYLEVLDIISAHASAMCFKAISIPRHGIRDSDATFTDLMFHLLVRGVKHERDSGRATLPRMLSVWKDAESDARDRLLVANLVERLGAARSTEFESQLELGEVVCVDSKKVPFVQFADLFTGSLNRQLQERETAGDHPKDVFSREFLRRFGAIRRQESMAVVGDSLMISDV